MSFEKNSASVSWPEIAPSASYPARRARARRFVGAIAAGVLGADLLLSCCGQRDQAEPATKTVTVEPSPTAGATAATQIHGQLTFDWLNGNSQIIQVYPSPADTPHARISDGTF